MYKDFKINLHGQFGGIKSVVRGLYKRMTHLNWMDADCERELEGSYK